MSNASDFNNIIDQFLVRRLINSQFPQWADLEISPVEPGGWDNRTFRLGERMMVRLPSAAGYAAQVEKEQYWLPKLAPHLTLPIPTPLAMGKPEFGYPWHWSVYDWIDGETAAIERIADLSEFAADLAGFLNELYQIEAEDGLAPGRHNFFRGGSVSVYDTETRQAIAQLQGKIDTAAVIAIWEEALNTTWTQRPVWVHGDISWGNLLMNNGKLSAVIDFGSSAVGDPACDLAIAWTLFKGESRAVFRSKLNLDKATWARGRGWTIWKALIVMAGLSGTNPSEVENSRRALEEVVADYQQSA